jgi:hypothetical protein
MASKSLLIRSDDEDLSPMSNGSAARHTILRLGARDSRCCSLVLKQRYPIRSLYQKPRTMTYMLVTPPSTLPRTFFRWLSHIDRAGMQVTALAQGVEVGDEVVQCFSKRCKSMVSKVPSHKAGCRAGCRGDRSTQMTTRYRAGSTQGWCATTGASDRASS